MRTRDLLKCDHNTGRGGGGGGGGEGGEGGRGRGGGVTRMSRSVCDAPTNKREVLRFNSVSGTDPCPSKSTGGEFISTKINCPVFSSELFPETSFGTSPVPT